MGTVWQVWGGSVAGVKPCAETDSDSPCIPVPMAAPTPPHTWLKKLWCSTSCRLGRARGWGASSCERRAWARAERQLGRGYCTARMRWYSSCRSAASKGGLPVSTVYLGGGFGCSAGLWAPPALPPCWATTYMTQPSAHTSEGSPWPLRSSTSGARYPGVPQSVLRGGQSELRAAPPMDGGPWLRSPPLPPACSHLPCQPQVPDLHLHLLSHQQVTCKGTSA